MKFKGMLVTVMAVVFNNQLAMAGSISDTYTSGDTLTTTTLDNIKTEVNDNDFRINTNSTNIGINSTDISTNDARITDLETYTKTGSFYATPTLCHRGTSGGAPYDQTIAITPPGNTWGPSIGSTLTTAGSTTWLCPVNIQTPAASGLGSTLTLTGATLAAVDWSNTTCLVKAELRYKTFGISSSGTVLSTVYSGSNSTDYAFSSTSPITKPFPTFSQVLANTDILFVIVTIESNGTVATTNCRYSGVMVDYSITVP